MGVELSSLFPATQYPDIHDWAILGVYRGSTANGMYLPPEEEAGTDDIDLLYVCIPPEKYYLGLNQYHSRGTREIQQDHWDILVYEFRKFVSLLQQGNPNVLSVLWTNAGFVTHGLDWYWKLVERRNLFVGKHVFKSFQGYAKSQFEHMRKGELLGHMGAKRKALREKFGYDPKHAAHLIRLLRMGVEFLNRGTLEVYRGDASELLEIKRGEWAFDRIVIESDKLFKQLDYAHDHSGLPDHPDYEAIDRFCVDTVRGFLYPKPYQGPYD